MHFRTADAGRGHSPTRLTTGRPPREPVTPSRARRPVRLLAPLLTAGLVALSLQAVNPFATTAGAAQTKVPVPKIKGPITPSSGISFVGTTLFPLSKVGYEQSEFFLSGTAPSYTSSTPLTENGKWHVARGDHRSVHDPYRRLPTRERETLRWDPGRRVAQRHRGCRCGGSLVDLARPDDPQRDGLHRSRRASRRDQRRTGFHRDRSRCGGDQADRSGAVCRSSSSWRQLLLQHLRAGRRGRSRGRFEAARRTQAEAGPGARRIPVRLLHGHLRKRDPAPLDGHLQCLFHLQQRWKRRAPVPVAADDGHGADSDVHPNRPPRTGLPLRDRSGRSRSRVSPGPTTVDQVHPRVGDRRIRARRHLRPSVLTNGHRKRNGRRQCVPVHAQPPE